MRRRRRRRRAPHPGAAGTSFTAVSACCRRRTRRRCARPVSACHAARTPRSPPARPTTPCSSGQSRREIVGERHRDLGIALADDHRAVVALDRGAEDRRRRRRSRGRRARRRGRRPLHRVRPAAEEAGGRLAARRHRRRRGKERVGIGVADDVHRSGISGGVNARRTRVRACAAARQARPMAC